MWRERMFVALAASEWRNLCSIGEIYLHTSRPVWFIGEPDERVISRCLTVAPCAKLDSPYEYLILEVRRDWPAGSRMHSGHSGVGALSIGDVVSHHALSGDAQRYYSGQVMHFGIFLGERVFDREWSRWVLKERRSQARISAVRLARKFSRNALSANVPLDHVLDSALDVSVGSKDTESDLRKHDFDSLGRKMLGINSGAAEVRGQAAYYLASAILWVVDSDDVDPRDEIGIGQELVRFLEATRNLSWTPKKEVWNELRPAFDALNKKYPHCFDKGIRADSVGVIARLFSECDGNTLEPDAVGAMLQQGLEVDSHSGILICYVAACVLGPERTWQILQLSDLESNGESSIKSSDSDITQGNQPAEAN